MKIWRFKYYMIPSAILALVGCAPGQMNHFEFDPQTRQMVVGEFTTNGRIANRTERFPTGELKAEEWTTGANRVRLSFYLSGRLKAEERFSHERLTFGRYYSDDGKLEQSVGAIPRRFW